jgi:hypothetical protein
VIKEIRTRLIILLETWLTGPINTDTLAFTFKRERVDRKFGGVEVYFCDPDSDLIGDPEWTMTPTLKGLTLNATVRNWRLQP